MGYALTQEQAAGLCGLGTRRLRQLQSDPDGPQMNKDGQYDPQVFGAWLKQRALSGVSIGDDGKVYIYEVERARLTKFQADEKELQTKVMLGELIPSS